MRATALATTAPRVTGEGATDALSRPIAFNSGNDFKRIWQWMIRGELLAVAVIALIAISLHARFVTHVGGLWRDEANSVQLASLSTFREVASNLDYDSFPILFFALLRSWTKIFGVGNDAALRALGFVTGLGVLTALWSNARTFGARWPVLSLALIGLNPMLIRYGDSTRAYGLGIVLILLTFGSFWRLVNVPGRPSRGKILAATVLALLSVHCLYYNCVLLAAIIAGSVAVAFRARAWRTAVIVTTIGILAAVSLLPYLPMMHRMHEWTFLVNYPVDLPWLWKRACEVLGSPDPLGIWLWVGLLVLGIATITTFGLSELWNRFTRRPPLHRIGLCAGHGIPDSVLFAAVSVIVAVPLYAGFLWALKYCTQPWYYIALAAFAACALDVLFGAWPYAGKLGAPFLLPAVRLGAAFILICLAALPDWEEIPVRHTNVDLLARQLRSETTKDDLIVASHWQYAVSLRRYYNGPAEIMTLPPIDDYRFHRYDLALHQMLTAQPLQPVFSRVEAVLRSGHHVFFLGGLPTLPPNASPPAFSIGYRDRSGNWRGGNFDSVWAQQAAYFIRSHVPRYTQMNVPRVRVQQFERLGISIAEGWR